MVYSEGSRSTEVKIKLTSASLFSIVFRHLSGVL